MIKEVLVIGEENLAEREKNCLKRVGRVVLEKPCKLEKWLEIKWGGFLMIGMIGETLLVQIHWSMMKPAGESSASKRPSRMNPTLAKVIKCLKLILRGAHPGGSPCLLYIVGCDYRCCSSLS